MPSSRRGSLGGRPSSLTGGEDLIVILTRGQTETNLKARAGDYPLQRRDAGLAVAAFDASDLRLGHPDSISQLALRQAGFLSGHQHQPRSHGLCCLTHTVMITD